MSNLMLVGKGPSAVFAKDFEKWGDVAVVNDAGFHVEGPIKFLVVHELRVAKLCKPYFDRCELIVNPVRFYDHFLEPTRHIIPDHKVWVAAKATETCLTALEAAKQLNYKRIWCLGFDGGTPYAPGTPPVGVGNGLENDRKRRAMIEWFANEEDIESWFWPAHPPVNDVATRLRQGETHEGCDSGQAQ